MQADDTLTVIVNTEFAEMTRAYHAMYFPDIKLVIRTVDEANGSAAAILETCSHLQNQDVLFTWCDVIPCSQINLDTNREKNLIYTNYERANRYGVFGSNEVQVMKTPDGSGGCFGLYYITNFNTNIKYTIGDDFIDVIHEYGQTFEQHVPTVIDFGDMPKLLAVKAQSDKAREFNSIVEFSKDYLLKQALNVQGKQIIEREISWYEMLQAESTSVPTPKVFISPERTSFVMSKVQGKTIADVWNDFTWDERRRVFINLVDGVDLLFNAVRRLNDNEPVNSAIILRDVMIEAHDKLITRYNEVRDFVSAFGDIHEVNKYLSLIHI